MAKDFTAGMAGVLARFEEREQRMIAASHDVTVAVAEQGVQQAKADAPWDDATGQAREQLHAEFGETANGLRFTLAHGVAYGIYLENSHGSRYAILGPTMARLGPELQRQLRDIWH